jgi:hypothetical protein
MSYPRFVTARKLFNVSEASALPETLQHPCLKCEVVHDQPHLRAYLAANIYAKRITAPGGLNQTYPAIPKLDGGMSCARPGD